MKLLLLLILGFCFFFLSGCPGNNNCATCPSPDDTTSHNFVWQKFAFGEHSSSVLYDIAIIDENNIWAVGEIYMNDSNGVSDPNAYNAAHWDGNGWTLKRITVNFRGSMISPPLEGIFAFSQNDIWCVGSLPIHGDGENWTMLDLRSMSGLTSVSLSKAWGTSSSSMYFVGRGGSLVYYNGQHWQKIESGTTLNINDIWGDYNTKTNQYEILCVASNILESPEHEIIKINGLNAQKLSTEGINGQLSAVWFKSNKKYYVAGGGGLYEKSSLNDTFWVKSTYDFARNFLFRVRGVGINDVSAVGGNGDVLHYNMVDWKSYFEETKLNYGNYYSVAIKGNLLIAVGEDNPKAMILVGKR